MPKKPKLPIGSYGKYGWNKRSITSKMFRNPKNGCTLVFSTFYGLEGLKYAFSMSAVVPWDTENFKIDLRLSYWADLAEIFFGEFLHTYAVPKNSFYL